MELPRRRGARLVIWVGQPRQMKSDFDERMGDPQRIYAEQAKGSRTHRFDSSS